ncbi:MAG: hypothetical protein A2X11_12970 [Bacteroidetes bacterium GWE2_42_24]|nr:MAG: hypothetical protein A2X11_12970 [Bacteroidetes bacterium GWE2_42_24]OFY32354.1 MAG: hypothetical protein A2X09_13680 [Bacteroidetes bacterium GWF2_43_11]HCT84188.1 hypothetical protein [Candidatus Margulisiibacteriota bacterium]
MKKILIFCLIFTILGLSISAQRKSLLTEAQLKEKEDAEARGWAFGLNLGMVIPSNYSANFYNGADANENNLGRILNNTYYKQKITEYIGYNYTGWEIPESMPYKMAMDVGLYTRYSLDSRHGFFAQVTYHKLEANDLFLLRLDVPQSTNIDPVYIECPIVGQEERTHIDLGYFKEMPLAEKIRLNIEVGFNLNNTLVKTNKIQIRNLTGTDTGLEYSIKYDGDRPLGDYDSGNVYDIRQGGIGFGAFGGGTIRFLFSKKISFDPGFNLYFSKIALEGYNDFKPQFTFFARIIMTDFFSTD